MESRDIKADKECVDREKSARTFQRTEEDLQIKPAAYHDLLRNRDFLRLWAGQMISAIGDWVIVAVLFAFVDQMSGGKSYAISLMMLAKFLPAVLLGFLAGIIIDRLDRRKVIIATQTLAMVQAFTLAGLYYAGKLEVWNIIALGMILGVVNAFDITNN